MNTLNVTELHTYPRRWWAFVALSFSLLVIGLDNTVLNVALPTLARDLGATESQLQWIVDAYTLVFAGLLLTMGSLGDRFGRRKALIAGLSIFGLGSIMAALEGIRAKFGHDMQPGDVFINNDPYEGGTHLPDFFVHRQDTTLLYSGSDYRTCNSLYAKGTHL